VSVAAVLHVPPAAARLDVDRSRALARHGEQLSLLPREVFLQTNFNRRLMSGEPTPEATSAPAPKAPPAPPKVSQLPISYPWAPKGKGRSLGTDKLTPRERAAALLHLPVLNRPTSRDDCRNTRRPCPYVSCRSHLYLDVSLETGAIKVNFPGLETTDIEEVERRYAELEPKIEVRAERRRRDLEQVQARIHERETAATERLLARFDVTTQRQLATVGPDADRRLAAAIARVKVTPKKKRGRRYFLARVTEQEKTFEARGRTEQAAADKVVLRLQRQSARARIIEAAVIEHRRAVARGRVAQNLRREYSALHARAARGTAPGSTYEVFVASVKVGTALVEETAHHADDARARCAEKLRLVLEEDETTLDLTQMEDTCARDVAERVEARGGTLDLEDGGRLMNLTMERFRQHVKFALDEVRAKDSDGLDVPEIDGDPDDEDDEDGETA
jgi:hypothetical protein